MSRYLLTLSLLLLLGLPLLQGQSHARTLGERRYEVSNHLGNVMVVGSDRKITVADALSPATIAAADLDVVASQDYYPYGMLLVGRSADSTYRFGFNGMERDDEAKGEGGSYTTQFRQYDVRVGRWLSIDPVQHFEFSPYVAFDDNPVLISDPSGADGGVRVKPNKPEVHKIHRGETLTGIAKKYKVSVKDLADWNEIKDVNKIYAGHELMVSDPTEYNDYMSRPWGEVMELGSGQNRWGTINKDGSVSLEEVQGKTPEQEIADNKEFGRIGREFFEDVRDAMIIELAFMGGSSVLFGPELATGGAGYGTYRSMRTKYPSTGSFSSPRGVVNNPLETIKGFDVPKAYTYTTGGRSIYVSPNAMKHMQELYKNGTLKGPDYLRLVGQTHQRAINAAIDDVLSRGPIKYNYMYYSGGNEIMFGAPRNLLELPAVKHFR